MKIDWSEYAHDSDLPVYGLACTLSDRVEELEGVLVYMLAMQSIEEWSTPPRMYVREALRVKGVEL